MANEDDRTTAEASEAGETVDTMMEHSQDVGSRAGSGGNGLDMLMGVSLTVSVQLGRTRMQVADILNLGSGSVIELQKLASEPVEVLVNDSPFARGEVVVMEDHFAVKISELVEDSDVAALGKAQP